MIKVTITNDILNSIIEIELNRYKISLVELSQNVLNKLRKNSKKNALFKKIVALGYLIQQKYRNDIRNMLP